MSELLAVDGLTIKVPADDGTAVTLVDGLSFTVGAGERVAIVGESGCGKSVTARAIMQLDAAAELGGSIRWRDRELIGLNPRQLSKVRGAEIGMIFQDPLSALDPTMPIGEQVAEPLVARGTRHGAARSRAQALLTDLGVADAARRMKAYPHEFSGGMRQRVVMALALISEPSLLIADEPTTALDVRVQAQVLELLADVVAARGLALILITHDFGVVGTMTERALVMYAGRFIESAPVDDLLGHPVHPYTDGLLGAVPRVDGPLQERLVALPGMPPAPTERADGCAFRPRCRYAVERCETDVPELGPRRDGGLVACHRAGELEGQARA
ncbi:ABC transporter ATP-binding protein [Kribbella sp. GL6]|uniref:ABC transporter ATP-binding protein n=1 Tax=Kribbella sp. GL6 TaxID=3419765 RepID=UPI003D07A395